MVGGAVLFLKRHGAVRRGAVKTVNENRTASFPGRKKKTSLKAFLSSTCLCTNTFYHVRETLHRPIEPRLSHGIPRWYASSRLFCVIFGQKTRYVVAFFKFKYRTFGYGPSRVLQD